MGSQGTDADATRHHALRIDLDAALDAALDAEGATPHASARPSDTLEAGRLTATLDGLTALSRSPSGQADWAADASAAYLLRAWRTGSAEDILRALDRAQFALTIDSTNRAARWNFAVSANALGLTVQPDATIALRGNASASATTRTDTLRHPDLAMVRQHLWRRTLPGWARAVLQHDRLTTDLRERELRALLAASPHDEKELGLPLVSAVLSTESGRRVAQARLILTIDSATTLIDGNQNDNAARLLEMSRPDAEASPLEGRFALALLNTTLFLDPPSVAGDAAAVARLLGQNDPGGQRRIRWLRGLADMRMLKRQTARDSLDAVSDACRAVGDTECEAAAIGMAGGIRLQLGNEADALMRLSDAARRTALSPHRHRRWSVLNTLRDAAWRSDLHAAAAALGSELESLAEQLKRASLVILERQRTARATLAAAESSLDFWAPTNTAPDARAASAPAEFRRAVQRVSEAWHALPSAANREEFATDVLWLESESARISGDPNSLIKSGHAWERVQRSGNHVLRRSVALSRTLAQAQFGSLDTALAMLADLERDRLREPTAWSSASFDGARLARELQHTRERVAYALIVRQQPKRALSVLDARATMPYPVPGARHVILRDMGSRVVEFARVTPDSLVAHPLVVSPLRMRALASQGTDASRDTLAALLMSRWLERKTRDSILVLDLQGSTRNVPWAALPMPGGGLVVESMAVLYTHAGRATSPSVRQTTFESRAPWSNVLLLDAAPPAGANRLTYAADEGRRLAAIWGSRAQRAALTVDPADSNSARTPSALRAHGAAELVHIASHARLDADHPERSALFVNNAGAGQWIAAENLQRWNLQRVRLLIVAACETQGTAGQALGGLESLAGVLHSAGAHAVLGAAWPVDDRTTQQFMEDLHRVLAEGKSPVSALQQAQLLALRSGNPVRRRVEHWAAFQLSQKDW